MCKPRVGLATRNSPPEPGRKLYDGRLFGRGRGRNSLFWLKWVILPPRPYPETRTQSGAVRWAGEGLAGKWRIFAKSADFALRFRLKNSQNRLKVPKRAILPPRPEAETATQSLVAYPVLPGKSGLADLAQIWMDQNGL